MTRAHIQLRAVPPPPTEPEEQEARGIPSVDCELLRISSAEGVTRREKLPLEACHPPPSSRWRSGIQRGPRAVPVTDANADADPDADPDADADQGSETRVPILIRDSFLAMVLPPHARGRMTIAGRTRRLESLIALGETEPSTRYPGYHELFMPVGARVLLDGDDHQLVVRVSLRMTAPPPRPSSQSLSPFLRAVVISAIVHLGLVLCWTQWFAGPR